MREASRRLIEARIAAVAAASMQDRAKCERAEGDTSSQLPSLGFGLCTFRYTQYHSFQGIKVAEWIISSLNLSY